jgi:hypothetical protein
MWRLRWKFLRDHPIPGSGLLVGPLFTIAGLVMGAYHWYELGLPALVWAAIGALIFFASVIGILFQWWSQAQAAVMWTNSAPRDADEHTIASPSQRGRLAKRIVVQGTLSVVAAAIGGTGVYLYQANRLRPLPETPSSASTEVPVRPTSPKVANAPVLKEPVSQSSNTEIGHVRLLYDHTTGTLNLISRMPDDLIVTITEISGMYTSAALGFSNY